MSKTQGEFFNAEYFMLLNKSLVYKHIIADYSRKNLIETLKISIQLSYVCDNEL